MNYRYLYYSNSWPMMLQFIIRHIMDSLDKYVAAFFLGATVLVVTNLILPIFILLIGVGYLFATGLGAILGIMIGRNHLEDLGQIISNLLVLFSILILGVILLLVWKAKSILTILGLSPEQIKMGYSYYTMLNIALYPRLFLILLGTIILNDGNPKFSLLLDGFQAIGNLFFNIYFSVYLDQGIFGLGLATLTSSCISCFFGLIYLFSGKTHYFRLKPIRFHRTFFRNLKDIIYNGASEFVAIGTEGFVSYLINILILRYLDSSALTVWSVTSMFVFLVLNVYFGAMVGMQPLFSQYMGSKKFLELRIMLKTTVKYNFYLGILFYATVIPIIAFIMRHMGLSPLISSRSISLFIVLGGVFLASNIPYMYSSFYTSIGRPRESILMTLFRTGITIPIFLFFSMKVFPYLWSIPLGYLLGDTFLTILFIRYYNTHPFEHLKSQVS